MPRSASRWASLLLLAGVMGIAGRLIWRGQFDSAIPFLPRHAPAEWIVYPNAPEVTIVLVSKPGEELPTTFRRDLVLERVPAEALTQVRAFEEFGIEINGRAVDVPIRAG